MILELAAIALTTKALVGIICGSVVGGIAVGSTVSYVVMKKSDHSTAEIEEEYEMLNAESAHHTRQRQHSLVLTSNRISELSETTLADMASTQERATDTIVELRNNINLAKWNHELGQGILDEATQDNRLINELMVELKTKTEQLIGMTDNYEALKTKLSETVDKLEEALTELDIIKKTILQYSGERDYTGHIIDVLKRMKSSSSELEQNLERITRKYEDSERRIEGLMQRFEKTKLILQEQENIISSLQAETWEKTQNQNSQYHQRFF